MTELSERIAAQVSGWGPARWRTATEDGRTRGDVMHGLIQDLADLCARAEGREPRPVPRLDSDYGLPDQLRVMARDLAVVKDDAVAERADELLRAAHTALFTGL